MTYSKSPMNIRELLLQEHSKSQSQKIASWIGNDKARFAKLANLILEGDSLISQRGAWILSFCGDSYPRLIIPFLDRFLNFIETAPHVAVVRNVLRVTSMIEIPEELEGKAYDLCYHLARQSKEDIAVRAHAMTIISTLALKYPELKPEVCDLLQALKDHDSAGLRSRSKKMIVRLKC